MPAEVQFSVVIPAFGRPAQLEECLRRLAPGTQTLPATRYEVIVTDDSRDDIVRELVQANFGWARWVRGPGRGPAGNRNHGAGQGKFGWLAFTDDDCLPEPGWLQGFADTLGADPSLDVLEGRTYADRPRQSLAERSPENTHGGFLWSCNLAIRKEAFQRLGGFDAAFPHASMEDVDFADRLRAAGLREKFVPAAAVCHPWRDIGGFSGMWRNEQRHLASVKYYLAKHPEMRARHSSAAYLKNDLRQLVRRTLPGLWKFRGRGAAAALAWHLHTLKCAWILAGDSCGRPRD